MNRKIVADWQGNMAFDTEIAGHKLVMDADIKTGGNDSGLRPKMLLLAGLAGCTGMDVVSMLKKMRVEPDSFSVKVEANLTDEHPKIFDKIHITYIFKGDDLPLPKLEKAVSLSQEKYCGVSAMFAQFAALSHEVLVLV